VNLDAGALVQDPMNPYADGGVVPDCHDDGECDAGMNGRCRWTNEGISYQKILIPKCTYDQCFSDQDCPSPLVCDYRGAPVYNLWPSNQCLPSGDCRVDSDCASGLCSPAPANGCMLGFFCHTSWDPCISDSDCPTSLGEPQRCTVATGSWVCRAWCMDGGA